MRNLGTNSTINMENNIYMLINLLKKDCDYKDIVKTMDKTPQTILKYLKIIEQAQLSVPEYVEFVKDEQRPLTKNKEELDQFIQLPNKKFYDNLNYFIKVFNYIK